MDPFSVTLGCISLLPVVERVYRSVSGFIVAFRDAEKDLVSVCRELSDLNLTLQMLKADTETKVTHELPNDLRRYISGIMENCRNDLTGFESSLHVYEDGGVNRTVKWTISGREDAEKIRAALATHKSALCLAAETITLHTTQEIKRDTAMISKDTTLIKEYTAHITKQLEKQDEILKQIAWLRAVLLHKSMVNLDKGILIEKYLDSLTDYAGSVCGDSVSEHVAREMNHASLDDSGARAPSIESEPSTLISGAHNTMTLVVGNTHRLVTPPRPGSDSRHMWTFHIRVSKPERVEEVRIYLHQTFAPSEVSITKPPFTILRIGWGYFTIDATIVLKESYLWEEVNSRYLTLEWELDFNGLGSSTSYDQALKDHQYTSAS